ncbi:MAG: D-alanyl-D-alanine carboxypeptidase/D-alanyl-D-alanine-endopeptidase [Pyrinomonadaceae bacterium]
MKKTKLSLIHLRLNLFAGIFLVLLASAAQAQDSDRRRIVVDSSPVISPTPTPTPLAAQPAKPELSPRVQTLADLRSNIQMRLNRPELRRGSVGIKVTSLGTGKIVFEENAEKYFMPASNMKNFTVAAGIEKLGPDFRYVTSVFSNTPLSDDGTVKGDLKIYGRGDVSISTAFSEGDYYKGLDNLADRIVQAGVKRIEGDLVGDESYFRGGSIPGSWEWDDLQWYYGAEISALPLNDNAVDLSVRAGNPGQPCAVSLTPINTLLRIVNQCKTVAGGLRRTLRIEKKLGQNILEITGDLPAGNPGFKGYVTVSHPADLFVSLLRQRLESKGVTITGKTRTVNTEVVVTPPPIEIARLESVPFSIIAAKTMKPSQNMYTETILWTLGEEIGRTPSGAARGNGFTVSSDADSAELGKSVVKAFLREIGIPDDAVIQHDGSGLSRHNLVTPAAVVRLYEYMGRRSKHVAAWRNSLTIGGVDGTLQNRFKGTAASGNVRGKTGTIAQVSALSGYVTTAGGEQLVFSVLVNGIAEGRVRTSLIDEIVLNLATFNGKID